MLDRITDVVSEAHIDALVDWTIGEIARTLGGRTAGFGWSGGKDSQALRYVAELAGYPECVLAITNLEYPEFLRWATDNMPWGLTIVDNGWDLDWLAANPGMLFPPDSRTAARWFKGVQHFGQERWLRRFGVDVIMLGRRLSDGNYTGPAGEIIYTNRRGVTRYSPLADWTHEEALALLVYKRLSLAPNYRWPRGFRVGTGPWPARQWTDGHGWDEVWAIDQSIVVEAARQIESATRFMEGR